MVEGLIADSRGVTPVVGKSLAAGIALLYVAGMTGVLLGGVVPDYETAAGDELGERVLATAAGDIETTIPRTEGAATARADADLPGSIEDASYRLELSGRTLRLVHPSDGIGGRTWLSLPANVTVQDSTWHSGGALVVRVSGPPGERVVRIDESAGGERR